jgi:predicted N-acetyltransferase YhbS
MKIRTENENDYKAVYDLHFIAFGSREDESKLVERIRQSEGFVPDMSIIAELDNEIIGHVLISKAKVVDNDRHHNVMVLAPVAVKPEFQKQGVGTKLINEGLQRNKDRGIGVILLIGHPSYYPRLGFKPARAYGLELKLFNVPDEVFMVCELIEGTLSDIKGELIYPKAFFG